MSQAVTTTPGAESGWIGSDKISVHNGMMFLIMMLNKFSTQQMAAGTAESETIQLLTNVEMKLSTSMMKSLEVIQGYINNIILSGGYCPDANGNPMLIPSDNPAYNGNDSHGDDQTWKYNPQPGQPGYGNAPQGGYTVYSMDNNVTQNELQSLNAQYSTVMQDGTINTDTIQGFIQAFQTALQMLMSAMQSMTSMYDSVSSKEAFDASLSTS